MYIRLLILISLLLPELAIAANMFEPVSGDKSLTILAALFGNLGVFGASSSDAFSEVVKTFNGGVLMIGGVLVAYTIFVGTIGTAHDGEMLGKKFSSVWVPIRTALGTALVLPVINGSYCIMQGIVGWLIVQGIGLADGVWSTYMSSSNIAKTVQIGLERPQVKDFSWKVMSSLVCLEGYKKIYSEAVASNSTVWTPVTFATSSETTATSTIISFGAPNGGAGFKKDSCGTVTVSRTDPIASNISAEYSLLGDLSSLNGDLSAADAKNLQAVQTMISSLTGPASSFAANPSSSGVLESAVNSAAAAYSTTMKDAASGIVNKVADFGQLQKSATQDGWMLAGAWYMRMSYLMDVAQKAVGKTPEGSGAIGEASKTFHDQFIERYVGILEDIKAKSKDATEFGVGNSISQSESAEGGMWDFIKSGFSMDKWIKKIFKADAMSAAENNAHPIMEMKRVGNWAGIVAATIYLKYGAAIMALGTLQGTGVSLTIATLPIVLIIFPMLMILTFTLSFVLPMMPFMIWIGIFLGWVILCVEAILAAPIWAVMHLSPNGDDMVGTGAQGYRLVLSLMLRPVLMVFGLIAALTIITVFGQMINKVFFDVFILSQQDSNIFIWIISLLAAPMIYMGLMWTMITKTMNIMHVIPDQLLQWFGGGGSQLGSYGETMGGHSSQAYVATAQMGQLGSKGLDAKRNMADLNKQFEQVRETKLGNEQNRVNNLNNKIGAGASGIIDGAMKGIDRGDANHSLREQQVASQMEGAVDSLGGPESSGGMQFVENMQNDMSSGMSYSDAFQRNLSSGLDSKYGSGAAGFLAQSSGGKMSGSGFTQGMEQLSTMQEMYKKLPPADLKEKTSQILGIAAGISEKSGSSINDSLEKALSHAATVSKNVEPVVPVIGKSDTK